MSRISCPSAENRASPTTSSSYTWWPSKSSRPRAGCLRPQRLTNSRVQASKVESPTPSAWPLSRCRPLAHPKVQSTPVISLLSGDAQSCCRARCAGSSPAVSIGSQSASDKVVNKLHIIRRRSRSTEPSSQALPQFQHAWLCPRAVTSCSRRWARGAHSRRSRRSCSVNPSCAVTKLTDDSGPTGAVEDASDGIRLHGRRSRAWHCPLLARNYPSQHCRSTSRLQVIRNRSFPHPRRGNRRLRYHHRDRRPMAPR